jgi:hypothetical protein
MTGVSATDGHGLSAIIPLKPKQGLSGIMALNPCQHAFLYLFTVCSNSYVFLRVLWLPFGLLQMGGESLAPQALKSRARTTTTGDKRRLAILLRAIGKKSAFIRVEKNDNWRDLHIFKAPRNKPAIGVSPQRLASDG